MAVEVTKATLSAASVAFIEHPDDVAKFIDVVARKIDELQFHQTRS